MYAEVFQVVELPDHGGVAVAHRAALYGVEHLRGVEGEYGRVAEIGRADAVLFNAECVRRVVEYAQAVPFRDGVDSLCMAEISVNVDGQDGRGPLGDEGVELRLVDGEILGVDVAEHRRAAAAGDGVGGGGKGEGRGDDLAVYVERFQHVLEREVAVGDERQIRRVQVFFQLRFKLAVLHAHIGEPAAVPKPAYLIAVLLKVRHG